MSKEKYRYFLNTGSGRTAIEIVFADEDTVHIDIESNWMGSGGHRYRLLGKHNEIAPAFGWIMIDQVEYNEPNSDKPDEYQILDRDTVHEILGSEPILEYFRVENSPNPEHPADLELMRHMQLAKWNDTFDLLVIVQASTTGNLLGIAELGAVSGEPIDPDVVKHFVSALLTLDKTKYKRESDV